MSPDMEFDEDLEQRRLRHLEQRYRSAQNALAEARALYASLQEMPAATDSQRHQASLRVQRATQHLVGIQMTIELIEDQDRPVGARR
jgi:hypothetical protein